MADLLRKYLQLNIININEGFAVGGKLHMCIVDFSTHSWENSKRIKAAVYFQI